MTNLSRTALVPDNLYGSDTPLCNRSVAALAVGLTSMASTSCPIPASTTAGVYYIIALVDSGNSVPESNETNNTKASLALRYLPDLVPSSVGLTWLGGVLTVKDAVKNIGSYGAGAFTIRFSLSQITSNVGVSPVVEVPVSGFACSRTVTSLAAGVSNPVIDMASTSCSVGALAVGSYRVRVTDDANNTAVELNELNNAKLIGMFTVP